MVVVGADVVVPVVVGVVAVVPVVVGTVGTNGTIVVAVGTVVVGAFGGAGLGTGTGITVAEEQSPHIPSCLLRASFSATR